MDDASPGAPSRGWNVFQRFRSRFTKFTNLFTGSESQALEQELPHEPDDANNDRGRRSGSYGSIADEPIRKRRRKLSQSKSDDSEGSLRSTITTPHHSPTPNQTETGGTEEQRMQARITINPGAADMKNADVSLQNLVKPVSNHTGNQNAAPTPAAQNQIPYCGHQDATPRPVDQTQEFGCPLVGIRTVSMNPSFTIDSAGSSTISFNTGNTNSVSAPLCGAHYGSRNRNP